MNKQIIQIFLSLIVLIIVIFSFYFYKNKKNLLNSEFNKIENLTNLTVKDTNKTVIKDIKYYSKDSVGNAFEITSLYGKTDLQNTDFINMENVSAKINILNADIIFIYSDFAIYNNNTFETDFRENVKIFYNTHKITANNLKLFFQENLISISNNVTYESLDSKMITDKIEINTITKEIKIFMNDKTDKVKFLYKK